jgi:two-component system chemotaxis response regulator CheB
VKKIRVLVVDDSATMRGLIISTLSREPDIEIVGEAEDPLLAREAIKRLDPDVLTLDIEMPHMNGLDFLEKIMRLRPMPVVIVSTLTRRGADATIRALEIGAVDCIEKPRPGSEDTFAELASRLRIASKVQLGARISHPSPQQPLLAVAGGDERVIGIGASTGGVEALLTILRSFPENCPPTVVVQHMPPLFTDSLAARLDRQCHPKVRIATNGAPLEVGTIYLAPGGNSHLQISGRQTLVCKLREGPRVNGHCPSVDVLFQSLVNTSGGRTVGVLLTGMGNDGAAGLKDLKACGARTIVQNEQTSIVFGMPKAAILLGAADVVAPLNRIAAEILSIKTKTAA